METTKKSIPTVFDFPVHPAANVFPMLGADDLEALAVDIQANGLAYPLIVKDGVLIDGRNRRAACHMIGLVPDVMELNGQDPAAYIVSTNVKRRHLNKGQCAMWVALIFPEPTKYKRGGADSSVSEELTGARLSYARTVLRWAPELAEGVVAGAESLDKAYETAKDRKQKADGVRGRLVSLRTTDADLADKVVDEVLTLDDAEHTARGRRKQEHANRQGLYDGIKKVNDWKFLFNEAHLA